MPVKISDSDQFVTQGSRADFHWLVYKWKDYYNALRPGLTLPAKYKDATINQIAADYGVKAVGFGNWVNIEDRINYARAMVIALEDLNTVLGFGRNIGISGQLSITFGARGARAALAHYEPGTDIINLTRYARGSRPKQYRFLGTGGLGSFAHEYGHFMDYFAARVLERVSGSHALTGGSITSTKSQYPGTGKLHKLADEIMQAIIFKPDGQKTQYYIALKKYVEEVEDIGEYYIRRNEIWARAFETWIGYELNKLKIKNLFLTKKAYGYPVYMELSEIKAVAPLFRKFVKEFKASLNKFQK